MSLAIHVTDQTSPRLDRGASLDWRADDGAPWLVVSFHDNSADAQSAFENRPHHLDSDPAHYRINCHRLDLEVTA